MSYPYDPRVSYTGAQSISQSFAALAGGLQDFAQRQREAKQEADLLAAQNQKNDLIIGHLAGLKNPQGQPYVTPEQMAEYQGANAKKKKALAEGISANAAFDLFQAKQAAATAPLKVQSLPVPGGTPINVMTGQGMHPKEIQPPFTPSVTTVNTPAGSGLPAQLPVAMTSPNSAQFLTPPKPRPEMAGKKEKLDTGQTVIYDEKGTPHFSAAPPVPAKAPVDNWNKLNEEVKAASGANFFEWANADNPTVNKDGSVQVSIKDTAGKDRVVKLTAEQQASFADRFKKLSGGGTQVLAPQDQAALDWALANPKDPRAAQIKQKLGIQ